MNDRHEDPRPEQLKSWTAEDLLEALHDLEEADNPARSHLSGARPLNLRRAIYRRRLEEELHRRRTERRRDH